MRVAKHIQIARENGAAAGMAAFLAAPVSKLHTSYAEINSKRTDKTKLDAYCKLFGVTREIKTPQVEAQNTGVNIEAIVAAAVAQALAAQGVSAPSEAVAESKVTFSGITHDQAWEALGSDPSYRANKAERRNGPATNGQLYRLNEAGLLTLNA